MLTHSKLYQNNTFLSNNSNFIVGPNQNSLRIPPHHHLPKILDYLFLPNFGASLQILKVLKLCLGPYQGYPNQCVGSCIIYKAASFKADSN